MSASSHGGPVDPIDWPSFGMPEGVEVHFVRHDGWDQWDVRAEPIAASATLERDFDGTIHLTCNLKPRHFPILEVLMRAARAIEAGEVDLTRNEPQAPREGRD